MVYSRHEVRLTNRSYSLFIMTVAYKLEYGEILRVLYFTNVSNTEEITRRMTESTYPYINCTCVNSQLIFDSFQLAVAANKAVVNKYSDNMITKSLPTELLFSLSISENITASLEKFGYGTRYGNNILLAIFSQENTLCNDIERAVNGTLQSSYVCNPENISSIKAAYDITDEQLSSSSLLDLIVTKISCKSL